MRLATNNISTFIFKFCVEYDLCYNGSRTWVRSTMMYNGLSDYTYTFVLLISLPCSLLLLYFIYTKCFQQIQRSVALEHNIYSILFFQRVLRWLITTCCEEVYKRLCYCCVWKMQEVRSFPFLCNPRMKLNMPFK